MQRFTEADIEQIKQRGANIDRVARQLAVLQKGQITPLSLARPCAVGDGIVSFTDDKIDALTALFEAEQKKGKMLKFVPASGAASRMFAHWQSALNEGGFATDETNKTFLRTLPRHAFYPLLCETLGTQNVAQLEANGDVVGLLSAILTEAGLGYGSIPKALLAFHRYGGAVSTSIEEHLTEAAHYCADENGVCRVHFTVAAEHKAQVEAFLEETLGDYERVLNVKFLVDLSVQSPATDTIALDEKGELARDNGRLLFRAGGHGALLKNLQGLQADVIFIKNIDNVAHSSRIAITAKYKKMLAGYLLELLTERKRHLHALLGHCAETVIAETVIDEAAAFCAASLNHRFMPSFADADKDRRVAMLRDVLAKPLRVCGVVHNEGEPGGAPFWVQDANGLISPQIVEGFQVDSGDAQQQAIWKSARHFNPVDIVCSINTDGTGNDDAGGVFDLSKFANDDAVSITQKQDGGKTLKVLELPGLWNGGMALWNTVFVEVPLATFNPVKTIDDLLRPTHQEE